MRVELKPGEAVTIGFADSDGDLAVKFGCKAITVETEWPDSHGRKGVIYSEEFGNIEPGDDDKPVKNSG